MKKVLILIGKSICVMMPVIIICIFARTHFLSFADEEAPYYIWNKSMCTQPQRHEYDVLILGDSGSNAAYVPELLSDKTLNLALGGTTPVENYYFLKEYLEHNESPRTVYMSFHDVNLVSESCFWRRTMYTHRFSLDELGEIMARAEYYNEASILTSSYKTDFLSYELYLPNKYITSMMNASINGRKQENNYAWQLVDLHRGRYISLSSAVNLDITSMVISDFNVAPLLDEYYRKIIELCEANGITVRVLKIPYHDNISFTEEYESQFYSYYNALIDEYPNLTVDWIKESPGYLFYLDYVHMNNNGARVFSQKIKSLHPEDFEQEISDEQMTIIDHNIQIETTLKEIFGWIAGREYTAVLYDGTGNLEEIYRNELQGGLDIFYTGYDNIYFISGTNTGFLPYGLEEIDGVWKVKSTSGEIFDWNPVILDGISICVMNDRFSTPVSIQHYSRINPGFSLGG